MMLFTPVFAVIGATLLRLPANVTAQAPPPSRFGLYYSGPPCPGMQGDRTFSQFQVILGAGCETQEGSFYAEAVFPLGLLDGEIEAGLDLMRRPGVADLQGRVRAYRTVLTEASGEPEAEPTIVPTFHAAERLEERLFEHEAA